MKIFITGWLHHKNKHALEKGLGAYLTNNIDEATCVYSPSTYIDVSAYPTKKFIFGPHFSVRPEIEAKKLTSERSLYIQPSEWVKNLWAMDYNFNNIPMVVYPFGVDTEIFQPGNKHNNQGLKVAVYFKRRKEEELRFVTEYLTGKNIEYRVFSYGSYQEHDYVEYLKSSNFCIWIGTHESQGFAFEECLSTNVPILVWEATNMSQEVGCPEWYNDITTPCTTCPYWDDRCGEKFQTKEEFETSFENFVKNVELSKYNPREYILENLTIEKQARNFIKLFDSIKLSGNTTFVTAFFDLSRVENNRQEFRKVNVYVDNGIKLLSQPFKFIVFGEENFLMELKTAFSEEDLSKRLTFVSTTMDELPVCKILDKTKVNLPVNSNPKKDTYNYMALMLSKTHFVEESVKLNPYNSSHFAWIDFGFLYLCTKEHELENIPRYLEQISASNRQGIVIPGCKRPYLIGEWLNIKDHLSSFPYWLFCGGFFHGDIQSLVKFNGYVKEALEIMKLQDVITWEMNVWIYIYNKHPELFIWYFADHNIGMLANFLR